MIPAEISIYSHSLIIAVALVPRFATFTCVMALFGISDVDIRLDITRWLLAAAYGIQQE
jgi:hypothetical protein